MSAAQSAAGARRRARAHARLAAVLLAVGLVGGVAPATPPRGTSLAPDAATRSAGLASGAAGRSGGLAPSSARARFEAPLGAAVADAAPRPLPTPLGFVSDLAGVLDPATERAITARVEELRRKTGSEIAVVTVDSTAPDTAFDYALRLAEAWKPGAAGKDNGVVFLVAVRDREMFIATGYGIEGALPDGLAGDIRDRTILPRFRAGDLAGGMRAGVERMAAIIAREYGVELAPAPVDQAPRRAPQEGGRSLLLLVAILVLLIVLFALFSSPFAAPRRRRDVWGSGPMWGGGFGGGGFGGGGGGFGGFGGGGFGGGGAGGKW